MEDEVKYDPQKKDDKDEMNKKLEEMLKQSDEMIEYYYDIKKLEKASLLFDGAQNIRWLVKLVQLYERNLDKALTTMLEHIESVKDLSYRWGLATTVLDQSLVDSIMLLTERRKGRRNDSGAAAE